jgi:hypothetical protein
MHPIPPKLRRDLAADPWYSSCARASGECRGRITWEHALMYAGKQVQERFAIIPLCEWHHLGDGLVKRINVEIAMARATPDDKKKYPLLPWNKREKRRTRNWN